MKYKVFKKCTKDFESIFTEEKEVKEIQIQFDGINITITEHQLDIPLKNPCVMIETEQGGCYMNLSTLIEKIM